jgi:hypothetical protein
MKAVLVDTNVAVVANGRKTHAGVDCTLKCIIRLERVMRKEVLLLDDKMRILAEYRRNLSPSGQPGPGDAFMKWVWNNQANTRHCRQIPIRHRKDTEDFIEYPQDKELAGFDRSDRKFVAVALASKLDPPIINAVDTDWWDYQEPLRKHGVSIEFLCPEIMDRRKK